MVKRTRLEQIQTIDVKKWIISYTQQYASPPV